MTDYPDLIQEAREMMTRQEWMPASLAIRFIQALEDATRDNAQMCGRIEQLEAGIQRRNRKIENLVAQVSRAREALDHHVAMGTLGTGVAEALRRILSDPDTSAGLRAIQADARREVIDWIGAHWNHAYQGNVLDEAREHFRTEEADHAE